MGSLSVPSESLVQMFVRVCDMFFHKGENSDKTMGVFDDLGYNLSGFYIVSYLIASVGCGLEASLASFANSRPPGIYDRMRDC